MNYRGAPERARFTLDPIGLLLALLLTTALPGFAGEERAENMIMAPHQSTLLEVGPGKPFARLEEAVAAARPGDTVLVHPLPGNAPYERVAVRVSTPRLTIRAATYPREKVPLSGEGYEYSGRGSVPRAIVQFDPGADGASLEGFELSGAHNDTDNGAGVRIVSANDVAVRHCQIHHNDMGVMSSGDGTPSTASGQLFEYCRIHHNGSFNRPGYNHNLYLGGTSATLRFCEVHSSLTGHNVKSRAHLTRVEYSYIHHSANREFDLVDDKDTARPGSHAWLVGNIIAKDPHCQGNREVIHFGQDIGGQRQGTLFLVHNTLITPFPRPIVHLSSPQAGAHLAGNLLYDGGAHLQDGLLASPRAGADLGRIGGTGNWISAGFSLEGTALSAAENHLTRDPVPFADPENHDYRLTRPVPGIADAGRPADELELPADAPALEDFLSWEYRHPAASARRPLLGPPDLGAHECGRQSD